MPSTKYLTAKIFFAFRKDFYKNFSRPPEFFRNFFWDPSQKNDPPKIFGPPRILAKSGGVPKSEKTSVFQKSSKNGQNRQNRENPKKTQNIGFPTKTCLRVG